MSGPPQAHLSTCPHQVAPRQKGTTNTAADFQVDGGPSGALVTTLPSKPISEATWDTGGLSRARLPAHSHPSSKQVDAPVNP